MALIKCPECKGKVSNTISKCPQCGYVLSDEDEIVDNKTTKINKKMLWTFITIVVIIVATVLFFILKPCEHQWIKATCNSPAICELCEETEGKALGHKWKEATCTVSKTCSICGEIEGKALGHKWKKATCTAAKTCSICGETEGKVLGHKWKKATCTTAKTCSACGETEGKALGHKWKEATYAEPKTCSVCGKTKGSVLKKPETKVVGTYQMSYLDDFSTVTESLHFYSDGSVVHKCSDNDDDGYGSWTVNGTKISFTLFWNGSDHTEYETATIVEGGIMWGSSFLSKKN